MFSWLTNLVSLNVTYYRASSELFETWDCITFVFCFVYLDQSVDKCIYFSWEKNMTKNETRWWDLVFWELAHREKKFASELLEKLHSLSGTFDLKYSLNNTLFTNPISSIISVIISILNFIFWFRKLIYLVFSLEFKH